MAVGVRLLHDFVVYELLELLLGEAMHQLAGLMRRLEVLAVLAHFVDVDLHLVSVLFGSASIRETDALTTGVSNSYSFFHLVWPAAITSISLYSKGLRSHTLDMTPLASVHSEQFCRMKSVRRRLHCWRRMAEARIVARVSVSMSKNTQGSPISVASSIAAQGNSLPFCRFRPPG